MLWLCIHFPHLATEALASPPEALERLAGWAYQWSSQVSYQLRERPLLWLELDASRNLFGGHAALLARLDAQLQQLGYSHAWALAPTSTGAALMTQLPGQRCVFTLPQLRARLETLPLSWLELGEPILTALYESGLRRIGQVLELPGASIARRFGPDTSLYLQRLCGAAREPRTAWRPPPTYRARCEFAAEVRDSTALLFPLQRLLLEFQGYLRGSDRAVLRFTLRLEHHRRSPSSLTVGMSAPTREAAQLLLLARERLHGLVLAAPVLALGLEALEFTAPAVMQADLFGDEVQPLQQLQLLLDRLRARLGEQQVLGLQLLDDFRPERAWRCVQPEQTRAAVPVPAAVRPCALLPEPRRIEPPAQLLRGPERIESGWWDGEDAVRDYYLARCEDGARWWVFQDRRDGLWYLQGLWV
jgi:protein ImuB